MDEEGCIVEAETASRFLTVGSLLIRQVAPVRQVEQALARHAQLLAPLA